MVALRDAAAVVMTRIRTMCFPSSDALFARAVELALESGSITSTRALEDALRESYPGIRVRARELSGEPWPTWYVYRDRDFPGRP
jgi:hypothetical protein